MKRKVPRFTSDEQAETFLEQDLSDLDFSQFKPTRFEFQKKTAQINLRIPKALLEAVKRVRRRVVSPIRALFAKPLNWRFIAPKNRGERRLPLLVTLAATARRRGELRIHDRSHATSVGALHRFRHSMVRGRLISVSITLVSLDAH